MRRRLKGVIAAAVLALVAVADVRGLCRDGAPDGVKKTTPDVELRPRRTT
jgi:hypothetical protein